MSILRNPRVVSITGLSCPLQDGALVFGTESLRDISTALHLLSVRGFNKKPVPVRSQHLIRAPCPTRHLSLTLSVRRHEDPVTLCGVLILPFYTRVKHAFVGPLGLRLVLLNRQD